MPSVMQLIMAVKCIAKSKMNLLYPIYAPSWWHDYTGERTNCRYLICSKTHTHLKIWNHAQFPEVSLVMALFGDSPIIMWRQTFCSTLYSNTATPVILGYGCFCFLLPFRLERSAIIPQNIIEWNSSYIYIYHIYIICIYMLNQYHQPGGAWGWIEIYMQCWF